MKKLNKIAKQLHESAKAKGFWDEKRETGTLLMLIVSELSEALEADRKNKHCNWPYFIFDENNDEEFAKVFEDNVKDTFEDEVADTMIRLFDLIGHLNIDIERHIELKMKYNQTRAYKHGKRY